MKLEQVARRARVSTATVSRVINNVGLVKPTTRARVLKAVEALKYSPNLHARSLAGGKSRSIGVLVSNIENPFFLDIYKAVEGGSRRAGYELIMANTDYSTERLVTSVRLMIGRRVAGLAAIVSEIDVDLIEELNGNRIPVVFYDVGAPRPNITNIRVNYRRGMETLVSYLYSLGHRRVGFVGHHESLGPINERAKVLLDAAKRYEGLRVETATDADSLEGGRRAVRSLLASSLRPTAIVCVNDLMAVGALRGVREQGLRVPGDVSVTGFDNVNLAQFCDPALTTVHIPRDLIGRTICECLMDRDRTRLEHEFFIDPELVLRDSTGPAAS
jgi:LacI family transcriptional regulator